MNWIKRLFTRPVPEPQLNRLESALLQSLSDEPEKWVSTRVPGKRVRSYNREKLLTVTSSNFNGIWYARSNNLEFSRTFAIHWHSRVLGRLSVRENREQAENIDTERQHFEKALGWS